MILDELSENITIKVKKKPFRHVVMENVFKVDTYREFCKEFDDRIKRGFENNFAYQKFWKFSHYDAYCYNICPDKDTAYGRIVYDPDFRKFINGFFNHKLTPHVLAELHHHLPKSDSGYIHNDYDIASFVKKPLENGMNPHRYQCKYRGRVEGAVHCVRSIAILYYFNNNAYRPGLGGETAFFTDFKEGSEPAKRITPNINKLVAFEVSPQSWHSFLTNKTIPRNSLVMWYHCPEKWAIERYKQEPK